MEFLGIGPLEFIFILIIGLIVLGPNDMVKAGRTIGKFLRQLITSPNWRILQQTSQDLRKLPNKLIRDAGLDEEIVRMKELSEQTAGELKDLQDSIKAVSSSLPTIFPTNLALENDSSSINIPKIDGEPPSSSGNPEATSSETQVIMPPYNDDHPEESSDPDPYNDSS